MSPGPTLGCTCTFNTVAAAPTVRCNSPRFRFQILIQSLTLREVKFLSMAGLLALLFAALGCGAKGIESAQSFDDQRITEVTLDAHPAFAETEPENELSNRRRLTSLGAYANETALAAFLVEGYNPSVAPRSATGGPVQLTVQYSLRKLIEISTADQEITMSGWWRHYWIDRRLCVRAAPHTPWPLFEAASTPSHEARHCC